MTRILVVDDEEAIVRALSANLRARGFDVDLAATGEQGLDLAARRHPDAVILDLGLPGMDGGEVIRGLRGWSHVPIIILSARSDEAEKVAALDAGADDYVPKPFGMDELMARLRAALRRAAPADEQPRVTTEAFSIDLAAKTVTDAGGTPIHLTPIEWSLLEILVRNPGASSPSATCYRRSGGRSTARRPTTCGSTSPICGPSSSPSRPGPATSSPNRAWATASRPSPPPEAAADAAATPARR